MSTVIIGGDTSGSVTLSAPAVSGSSVLTLPVATDTLVGKATTDTLTNKTLTSPVIATIVNSGTLTLPTSTDTLVGKATTDTLTNKSIAVTQLTGTLPEANGGTGTTTGYYGFKNRIINGAMVIDQRNAGASQTFTAAAALAYSVDRWYGYCTGANVTGQQVAGATTPTVTQNRYRFTGAASVTAVGFGQRIEQKNSYDLAGSTCTLSADLGISATLTTVTWTAYYATTTADTFGTLASPTVTSIATGTFTVGATVTNFSANISVPAAATTGIQILFTVGALTAGLTWTIGNVQLEKGSTATSFDYRPYGTELALCQRYYEVGAFNVTYYFIGTLGAGFTQPFKVTKRATPTSMAYTSGPSYTNASSAGLASSTPNEFTVSPTTTVTGACAVVFGWAALAEL